MTAKPITGDSDRLTIEVIGQRPQHRPYVWIGDRDGHYVDSLSPRKMRALARRILKALDGEPKQP